MGRRYLWWLVAVVVGVWGGCRNGDSLTSTTPAIPFHMQFVAGDTFTYDFWMLDGYGYPVLSGQGRRIWHVTGVGGTFDGTAGVTTVVDSVITDSVRQADTLYFQFSGNGDVFQRGLLAGLIKRREGREIPARWECIAAFSQGSRSSWTVGYVDSAGTQPVYGQITGNQKFFLVSVNGVQTVLTVHEVEISGPNLQFTILLTDSPSAIAGFRDESSDTSYGQECDLSTIVRTAPAGRTRPLAEHIRP